MQVKCEQSPVGLPDEVVDHDFKKFTVGSADNVVRKLLVIEGFNTPANVRILTWNTLFRSLKGVGRSIHCTVGGIAAEVWSASCGVTPGFH
jgi:hypothetical protein